MYLRALGHEHSNSEACVKTASLWTPVLIRKPGTLSCLGLALHNTKWKIGNTNSCIERMSIGTDTEESPRKENYLINLQLFGLSGA